MSAERLTLEQATARVAELCAAVNAAPGAAAAYDLGNPFESARRALVGIGAMYEHATEAQFAAVLDIVDALFAYARQLAYDEGYAAKGESVAEELGMAAQAANDALDSGSTEWFAPAMSAGQVRLYADIVTKLAAEERAGEILRGVP